MTPPTERTGLETTASTTGRTVRRRLGQVAGLALVGAAYWTVVRPRMMHWGATPEETARSLPGDELLAEADGVSTMAITIEAPTEAIWPWLRQLGQGRGGFYSYTWAENLFGLDIHNADEIRPEHQRLAVGETIRLGRADRFPDAKLEVAAMAAERSLVLRTQNEPPWWVWAFVLDPVDASTTRLLVRASVRFPENPVVRAASRMVLEPVTAIMTVGMLRGIKSRAERTDAIDVTVAENDGAPPHSESEDADV